MRCRKTRLAAVIGVVAAFMAGGIALWYFFTNDSDNQVDTTAVPSEAATDTEPGRAPTTEEINELVLLLASQDEEAFLEAWPPGLEDLIGEDGIQALMPPEDSTVSWSGEPLWSDDNSCWTINLTIEVTGEDSINRTMCLESTGDQWHLGDEVKE